MIVYIVRCRACGKYLGRSDRWFNVVHLCGECAD